MNYLLKTEPGAYSISDLKRDGETVWDGVTNPAAVKNLREMHPKDRLIIYHTGDERAAVGTATVVSVNAKDPKVPLVRIRFGENDFAENAGYCKRRAAISRFAIGPAGKIVGGSVDRRAVSLVDEGIDHHAGNTHLCR